jgi:cation transport regulator ChaC
MSKPTKEYYEAKADLCKDLAIKQMTEGKSGEAAKNLFRMINALNEVNLIEYREGKAND